MTTLVIVESLGKVAKLRAILGDGYRVVSCAAHARELASRHVDAMASHAQADHALAERAQGDRAQADSGHDSLAPLRNEAATAESVLLATDPDGEGEALAWHLADALNLADARRVRLTEITPAAIHAAIAAANRIDMDRVQSHEARLALDRLVGHRVSAVLSSRHGQNLAVGRLQTPALRLIVEREREIAAFEPVGHHDVDLIFPSDAGVWRARWVTKPHLLPGHKHMTHTALAARVAAVRTVTVESFADGTARQAAKAPFTTASLQSVAGIRLKFKPKQVMALARRLYEQGAISYYRSSGTHLSVASAEDIAAYARSAGLPLVRPRRVWRTEDCALRGEAIRPTQVDIREAGESRAERALYKLIWMRTVASQLMDAQHRVRTVILAGVAGHTPVLLLARGRSLLDPGWMAVYDEDRAEVVDTLLDDCDGIPVPSVAVGEVKHAIDGKLVTRITQPPPRFRQGALVAELESHGLGGPSTYAPVLDNLMAHNYVAEDRHAYLVPTADGERVHDAVAGKFQFADFDHARHVETRLEQIAHRDATFYEVISSAWQQLSDELEGTDGTNVIGLDSAACPRCGIGHLRRIQGSQGYYWGCTRFREGCEVLFEEWPGHLASTG